MSTGNVMILSGRFGKGHDTVAEASAAALASLGVEIRTFDAISLLGGAGGMIGERVFRSLLGRPAVYDAFHFSVLRTDGRLARRLDRIALRKMQPAFAEATRRFPPVLILSVFATGAAAGAHYKATHPDVATVVVITDSYAHRLWVHEGTDLFLVTSAVCAHSVRSFLPQARVAVVTHPTRPGFYRPPDKLDARAQLGIPAGSSAVLLMSGAWGIGPVAECAEALAAAGIWVIAVAGNNTRLLQRLRIASTSHNRIMPFGFTDEVPLLMAAADAVVTSSGDTCREARVVGRPLVLLDVVPGHGRENLMHEVELGHAVVSLPEPAVLVGVVERLLDDSAERDLRQVSSPAQWEQELLAALASIGFG